MKNEARSGGANKAITVRDLVAAAVAAGVRPSELIEQVELQHVPSAREG